MRSLNLETENEKGMERIRGMPNSFPVSILFPDLGRQEDRPSGARLSELKSI